jgi:GDP-4-dehydro-6-deoxy-D-mannose reductase
VGAVVEWARPDTVFHLAGESGPEADACFSINLDGTRHLLEACERLKPAPTVLVVSSAAVYGLTAPEESPVRESTPLRPLTAYGASKAAAEIFALTLHRRGLLRVAVARPFNLVGPGLRPGLAPSDFMAQASAIRAGRAAPEIRVGSLEPRRDFVDVRDAALAYVAIAVTRSCAGQAWNVASGHPVGISDLLTAILRVTGVEARVVQDPARLRAVEVPEQVGDASALTIATGWSPRVTLEESLRDMVAAGS